MDKNVHIKNDHNNLNHGSTDVSLVSFKEDPWQIIVDISLQSETKKKLYRYKFMKRIYEQYFI